MNPLANPHKKGSSMASLANVQLQLLQVGDASTLEFHRLRLLAILKYEFCFKEGEL